MEGINFIAIDFETATSQRSSICEAGICVVRNGKVVETRSWLVRPENNQYNYWNTQIHGISARDTANAPEFPIVWNEICKYLADIPILVAHNAGFDMSCIRSALLLHNIPKPNIQYYCTLQAARRIYNFSCNKLNALCDHFEISYDAHHRAGNDAEMCARLFLQELKDNGWSTPEEMEFCRGDL